MCTGAFLKSQDDAIISITREFIKIDGGVVRSYLLEKGSNLFQILQSDQVTLVDDGHLFDNMLDHLCPSTK